MQVRTEQQFFAKQNEVYGKFGAAMHAATLNGMQPDPVVTGRSGGYLVVFRPAAQVLDALQVLTEKINGEVPGLVVYSRDTLHTTLGDYKVAPGFVPDTDPDHEKTLVTLREAVEASPLPGRGGLSMRTYEEGFAFNETTLILRGQPCGYFVPAADYVRDRMNRLGIDLRFSWGAHVTIARAAQQVLPSHVQVLRGLINEAERGWLPVVMKEWMRTEQIFPSLLIGSFTFGPEEGFKVKPYWEVDLSSGRQRLF